MHLLRNALLAAGMIAVGAGSASAQFVPMFRQGVTGPFLPRMPVGGFGVNGFRYVSNVNYNINVRNGPFTFNWTYQDTRFLRTTVPVWTNTWFGYNPYLYPSLYGSNNYFGDTGGGFERAPAAPAPLTGQVNRGQGGVFSQWALERDQGVSADQRREQLAQEVLERQLNQPAQNDVTSGAALNAIRTAIDALGGKAKEVAPIALTEDVVRGINFANAGGGNNSSPALLADAGRITWPRPIASLESVAELRQQVEKRFKEAYAQADKGKPVDRTLLKELDQLTGELEDAVAMNVARLGFDDHRESKRFLKSLADAVVFLKQPDAGKWLPGRVKIAGKSVQELLKAMTEKGARFAAATPGSEQPYFALHQALADYYRKAVPDDVAAQK